MNEIAGSILLLVVFVLFTIWIFSILIEHKKIITENIQNNFDALSNDIEDLRGIVNEIKDVSVMTDEERERYCYENCLDLNVEFFNRLNKDQVISLVSGSYFYPSDEIFIERFKFRLLNVSNDDLDGKYKVSGLRENYDNDWEPHEILCDYNECVTLDHSGDIKLGNCP
jgi:hypothetical protein